MPVAKRRGPLLSNGFRPGLWSLLCLLMLLSLFVVSGRNVTASPVQAKPASQALQPWIDATPTGGHLRLLPGTYTGPALITRPITLEGNQEVIIDGQGLNTVLTVHASDVTLRGLRFQGSGVSHDRIDSGLMIEGDRNLIEDNVFDDVLFGITLHQANNNIVRRNTVRSKDYELADRGDGLRLWYSMSNRIEANHFKRIRDLTISNSLYNRFIGNHIEDSRRAMNFLFSHRSLVEDNHLSHNATGLTILNSEGIIIRRNKILHAIDVSGAGIALKESSAALVHDNDILHCAVGILADSPLHSLNRITIIGNRFAHNITGISFYGEKGGHLIYQNRFEHNLWNALVGGSGDPLSNAWWGNYWDDYEGFDRNGDGVGDTPYEIWAYADRIWMETPMAKFFRRSPILELLDFLERLAPFSSPALILSDPAPVAHSAAKQ